MPGCRTLARALAGASLVTLAAAGSARSAALEQVVPATVRLLYQEGRYLEIGVTYTDPDQSGRGVTVPPNRLNPLPVTLPGRTGDVFEDRWNLSGAYKADINDALSYALIFDQPFAADTHYGPGSFAIPIYDGSMADLQTYQLTAALAYDLNPSVKLYGGLRAQRLDAKAAIPFVDGYSVDAGDDWGYGYLLGAAHAREDIALRVALTYFSRVEHGLDTREFTNTAGFRNTTTDVDTPQSVSLDFQTGVAPQTLVFGSVRWVEWSEFSIEPPLYAAATAAALGESRPLVDYADDWWTYSLGVGRQITDTLAGSVSLTYEPDVGGVMTTLGPYDGRTTGAVALSYDIGQVNLTGGLTYGVLGDTRNLLDTRFDDGSVWGAGLRVGYTF